jgi:hypothetical protein
VCLFGDRWQPARYNFMDERVAPRAKNACDRLCSTVHLFWRIDTQVSWPVAKYLSVGLLKQAAHADRKHLLVFSL